MYFYKVDINSYHINLQFAALCILTVAIVYLKHPENHVSHSENFIKPQNHTMAGDQNEESVRNVVQKAILSKYSLVVY